MIAEFFSSFLPMNSLENPRTSLTDPNAFNSMSATSDAGVSVTPSVAMTLAPVWQSVSIISGDIATSTANIFKRTKGGDREIDQSHPANFLISVKPNDEMSAFELWRRFAIHLLLWQNGYLYVEKQGGVGRPLGIYNLLPDRTKPKRDKEGTLYYVTEVDGNKIAISADQVIHVKGLSIDSGIGYELVSAARNSWGLALAAEGFGSKFFANGAQAGGIMEVPVGTTEKAAENLVEAMKKKHTGKDNWFRVMVLRDGARFHETTIDAKKSQLTELREHQVRDTARFFNLPPSKLGLSDSVSYNSSEQSQIQYITGCLTHWFGAIRGESQIVLLTEQEQRSESHFIDFNTSKLIERDLKTQVEILAIERQNEIINAAEWRKKRNLPPRTDASAMEYLNPNTKSNGAAPHPTPSPQQSQKKPNNELTPAVRAVCEDAIKRIARRVTGHARNAAKNQSKLIPWIDSQAADHRLLFYEITTPAARIAAEYLDQEAGDLCHIWAGRFFNQLVPSLDEATKPPFLSSQIEQSINERCDLFESTICVNILGPNRSIENDQKTAA